MRTRTLTIKHFSKMRTIPINVLGTFFKIIMIPQKRLLVHRMSISLISFVCDPAKKVWFYNEQWKPDCKSIAKCFISFKFSLTWSTYCLQIFWIFVLKLSNHCSFDLSFFISLKSLKLIPKSHMARAFCSAKSKLWHRNSR